MTSGIYSIQNKINGKRYIGQSKNIERRFKDHLSRLENGNHDNDYLQKSFDKYGGQCFEFKIVCECSIEDLDKEEKRFINLYGTYLQGYNLTTGGEISPMLMPEIRNKVSEAMKGEKNHNYGKQFSKQHKSKIKESNKGKHNLKNITGFYRVSIQGDKYYRYSCNENGKNIAITDKSLFNLMKKVKERHLEWNIINSEKAHNTLKIENVRTAQELVYGYSKCNLKEMLN